MGIELKQLNRDLYEVFENGNSIGIITLSHNSFHTRNLYLQLDFSTYDAKNSADIFKQLWKEQKDEKCFQIMCDSSQTEFIRFIENAGFICKRRCFESEVTENDRKPGKGLLMEIQQYGNKNSKYQEACELLYHQYAARHEAVNPLTASYNDFINILPMQIYAEVSENQIQNFAFMEENEIAYIGSVNKETYSAFLASVVKQLFSEYDTICFESDDTDPEAMQLKELFDTKNKESYNTYILEREEEGK